MYICACICKIMNIRSTCVCVRVSVKCSVYGGGSIGKCLTLLISLTKKIHFGRLDYELNDLYSHSRIY